MVYHRYHGAHRRPMDGPWKAVSRRHVKTAREERYRDWRVQITERFLGITLRRRQFHVVLRHQQLGLEHRIAPFPSAAAAQRAAREWIDGQDTYRAHQSGTARPS